MVHHEEHKILLTFSLHTWAVIDLVFSATGVCFRNGFFVSACISSITYLYNKYHLQHQRIDLGIVLLCFTRADLLTICWILWEYHVESCSNALLLGFLKWTRKRLCFDGSFYAGHSQFPFEHFKFIPGIKQIVPTAPSTVNHLTNTHAEGTYSSSIKNPKPTTCQSAEQTPSNALHRTPTPHQRYWYCCRCSGNHKYMLNNGPGNIVVIVPRRSLYEESAGRLQRCRESIHYDKSLLGYGHIACEKCSTKPFADFPSISFLGDDDYERERRVRDAFSTGLLLVVVCCLVVELLASWWTGSLGDGGACDRSRWFWAIIHTT